MITLNIPKSRDPIARIALLAMVLVSLWLNVAQFSRPASAQPERAILLDPAPTPALPTAAPRVELGAMAAPTPDPGWIDQQATAQALDQAAREQYTANVGAQAEHHIRDQVEQPPTDPPALDQQAVNDPAQNGGSIAPDGCPFPIVNGLCANGVLASTIDDDSAFGSKAIAEDRQPAGDTAPSAAPGETALFNPQSDHQCRHGQVWTDAGCKNPTSDPNDPTHNAKAHP